MEADGISAGEAVQIMQTTIWSPKASLTMTNMLHDGDMVEANVRSAAFCWEIIYDSQYHAMLQL